MPSHSSVAQNQVIYLGLDEGQSATRVVLLDEKGYVKGTALGPPGNLSRHTPNEIVVRWSRVVDSALVDGRVNRSQVAAAGFGLSSLVWSSDRPVLEGIVAQLELPCPTLVFDDCLMVLRAGLPQGVGIALLAGSGSGVIGRNADAAIFRTFNSSRLGDGGGGWALAERMIEWIARFYLGSAPETSLTNGLLTAFSFQDIPALLEHFVRHPIEFQRPQVIRMIFETYHQNDEAARFLLNDLAHRYAGNVVAVAGKLGFERRSFELVLSGGLFAASESPLVGLVNLHIRERLANVRLSCLQMWPAVGAALAAMDYNRFEVAEEVRLNALASAPRNLGS